MFLLVLVAYGAIAAAIGLVWVLAVDGRRRLDAHATPSVTLRSARRRAIIALVFTAFLLAVGWVASSAFAEMLGLPLAVAPLVAGSAGLLLYAATPPRVDGSRDGAQAASLTPRSAWNAVPTRTASGVLALAGALVAFLVICGLLSSTDEFGLFRVITFESPLSSSSASPFPGWYYGAPIIVLTLVFLAAAYVSLHRVASTPSLPGAGFEAQDRTWREATARVITRLVTAVLLVEFGGVAALGGLTARNALTQPELPGAYGAVALGIAIAGVLVLCASIVCLVRAIVTAVRLPTNVSQMPTLAGQR